MFHPTVLNPEAPDWFKRELKLIDPALRVTWGYERYLVNQWAIERKIPPERYHACYKSLLDEGGDRFVDQPIFDTAQPEFDDRGDFVCYKQIGVRKFDLAPEYEWMAFCDGLDDRILTTLKKAYAWHEKHPISRAAFEKKQEIEEREKKAQAKRMEAASEGIEEAFHELRKKVVFGFGKTRSER